jgi:hypothetical protein
MGTLMALTRKIYTSVCASDVSLTMKIPLTNRLLFMYCKSVDPHGLFSNDPVLNFFIA